MTQDVCSEKCACHLCAANDEKRIPRGAIDLSRRQSHESLLRHADYTCSGVRTPSVSGADVKLEFAIVDARPRLYANYTCRDGLVLKDRSRRFMYCVDRKWIGALPTCVIGASLYYHRCKKRFLSFFILVTFFYVFNVFFIFQTFFIFKKRWQSSERQAD